MSQRIKYFCLMCLIVIQACTPASNKISQPNIVVFIADDVTWNDLGCYGNEVVRTPNIDRIASQGVRFTNAFLTISSCSPSRISIITGRYPHNTGAAELHTEPSVDFMTLPRLLKENGYYTGQAGKWHMGELIKSGFDTTHLGLNVNGDGGEDHWLQSLRERDMEKPFFFWFDPYDAHRPWGVNKFSGEHNPSDIIPPVYLASGDSTKSDLAKYYDEIARLDYHVGQVEKELEKQGVLENTIIVIMADNGRPFPRDKTRVYESGIKTPFIIKGPERILLPGSVCNSLISVIDLAPTLLSLAGIQPASTMQGRSFSDLLINPKHSFRDYVFAEHNWHDYEAYERMVRSRDFLYIVNARPAFSNQGPADAVRSASFVELKALRDSARLTAAQADVFISPRPVEELYDCSKDSLQLHNVAQAVQYQEVLNVLRQSLTAWQRETGDNIPADLTHDWYDRETGIRIDSGYNARGTMPGL